jgi:hypothetical protein
MTPQPQQFDPEAFAAILAAKCAPGVIEGLAETQKYDAQRTEALSHPGQFIQYVQTKDEHDEINPIKYFPGKPYIPYLLNLFVEKVQSIFFIAKSRQIMLTWLCCVYALWLAKSIPHRLIFLQSKKEEDAANLVFNGGRTGKNWNNARISFIEKHLPLWLQDEGIESAYGKLLFPNGSKIWGVPEGADMIRSYTPSLVISDEAAFQPEFGSAYTAMLPIAKQGGMLISISSANPGPFGEIVQSC